jgi:hypothetical protein
LLADPGVGDNFERHPVNTKKERRALLQAIDRAGFTRFLIVTIIS